MSIWKRNTAIESRSPREWWVRYTSPSGIYYWFHESSGWVTEPNQINQPLYQTRGEAYHAMETAPPPPEHDKEPIGTVWHTTEKGKDIVSMHDYQYRAMLAAVAERDEAVKVLAEHMAAREKHETGPTVHTLHVLNVACVTVEENPTASAALVAARAAVDAAKGGTK